MPQSFASHAHHPVPTYVATRLRDCSRSSCWLAHGCSTGRRSAAGVVSLSLAVAGAGVDVAHLHHTAAGPHHHARDEGALRRGAAGRPGRASGRAGAEADRRAALCVGRGARRAAGARGSREAAAPEIKRAIKSWRPITCERDSRPAAADPARPAAMTPEEKQEVLHLIDAHERTLAVCRACAQTARDLAWEIKRGGTPDPAALKQTIDESERVLAELGQVEMRDCRDESRACGEGLLTPVASAPWNGLAAACSSDSADERRDRLEHAAPADRDAACGRNPPAPGARPAPITCRAMASTCAASRSDRARPESPASGRPPAADRASRFQRAKVGIEPDVAPAGERDIDVRVMSGETLRAGRLAIARAHVLDAGEADVLDEHMRRFEDEAGDRASGNRAAARRAIDPPSLCPRRMTRSSAAASRISGRNAASSCMNCVV